MSNLENLLKGGDLRSIGKSNKVVSLIDSQRSFDDLFQLLFSEDRKVVMRVADAIEKITISHSNYLQPHKREIMRLCDKAENKELKWHLALLVSRLSLSPKELEEIWQILLAWATNKVESKIVRVNSLQALFNLLTLNKELEHHFSSTLSKIEKENIPSLNARIKKLKYIRQNN
jgi:hypothetical protein